MKEKIFYIIKKIIPAPLFKKLSPIYHYLLALAGALIYRFPSRKLIVIGITGTKGKTSTTEILNAILEEAGFKTAIISTLRFKAGRETENNMFKMTMPGRFFIQQFLRRAVKAECQYAIIEMTSEGTKQFRHKFIDLDVLIFNNLSPEHIESHGSYEKYLEAKLKIAHALESSKKKRRIIVANNDDEMGQKFLNINVSEKYPFSLVEAEPFTIHTEGFDFTYEGQKIHSYLSGKFNLYNILGAIKCARSQGVSVDIVKSAIEKFKGIRGRVEKVEVGQDFKVIVDYAHTADSLEKLYEVFSGSKKICVLGNTGGGRDKWKRRVMAEVAKKHCSDIILTNEDPYDENPKSILDEMASALTDSSFSIILDRREAIAKALRLAETGDSVLITGKGTDPYIMGANGTKIKWDDATVAREELQKLLNK